MIKKITLFVLAIFISILAVNAQNKTVNGKIIDAENNEPLVGASVVLLPYGKNIGTTTNNFGDFSLVVPVGSKKLGFSMVGYKTIELEISDGKMAVQLEAGQILQEIVVTALGLERESKNLGYAIQKIDGQQLSESKAVNFLDNLSGKVAGVNVVSGSSGVGSSSKISIRGESSFTNTNPLFVVDGIPINNNTIVNSVNDDANGMMEVDFGNGAMEINSDDIASMSVLKGPAAAALYGTRASNGVVVITTKKGGKTKGLGVSVNSSFLVDSPFTLPKFQNKYGQGNSGKFAYKDGLGGGVNDNISYSYGPVADGSVTLPQFDSPVKLPNGSTVRAGDLSLYSGLPITATPFVAFPSNLKDFYNTGYTQINNVALSAGNELGSYRLSLTNLDNTSFIPGVDYKRKTLNGSFIFTPVKRLTVAANLNYINAGSDNRPATKYGSENINYALIGWYGRTTNTESLRDYWQPGLENVQQFSYNSTFFDNPFFTLNENRNSFERNRIIGNLSAKYQLRPDLSISMRSGMDNSLESRAFRRAFSSNRFKSGAYAEQNVNFREINSDFLLDYTKKIGNLGIEILAGGNRMDQKALNTQVLTVSLAQPGIFSFSNAASPLEYFRADGLKRINSIFGLAKLSFRSFLFVDITARNDWSSALATPSSNANTSFFYPSVSGSFVASNLWELPSKISFLKLRASYSKVGNDTNPFQTAGTFLSSTAVGGLPTFTDQNQIANANLKPESISSLELGTDIRFFDERLKIDLTYFNALNKNQILSLPIASSSGYNQQSINGGSVRSHGFEAVISTEWLVKSRLKWRSNFNFSMYRNIVESLPVEASTVTLAYNRIYDNVNQTIWYQVKQGGRMGDMYGTGYLKNANGDYVINANGQYIVDNNLRKLGNYNPDFILGIFNSLSYNNFNLNFLLDWHQGGQLVSRTLELAGVAGQLIETGNRPEQGIIAKGVINTGTAENPVYTPNTKAISAESYYRMYYDRNHEENSTYDASYLKLREMAIGYTVPTKMKRLQNLNITLIGRNLWALSKIPHFDPEQFGLQGNNLVSGVEDMAYPSARSIGLKVGVSF